VGLPVTVPTRRFRSGPVAPVFAVRVSAVTLHWLPACLRRPHRDPPCLAEPAGGNEPVGDVADDGGTDRLSFLYGLVALHAARTRTGI